MSADDSSAHLHDDPSVRLLLLDVLGQLHCLALPEASLEWTVSLLAGSRDARHRCPDVSGSVTPDEEQPSSLIQCFPRCISNQSSQLSNATALSSQGLSSGASGISAPPGSAASSPVTPCAPCAAAVQAVCTTSECVHEGVPLLSTRVWTPVLESVVHGVAPDGSDAKAAHSAKAALCRQVSWQWHATDGVAPQPCLEGSTVKDVVAVWNGRCCAAHKVLATEEHTERYAEVDLATGKLLWLDSDEPADDEVADSNEPTEERTSEDDDDRSSTSSSRASSHLKSRLRRRRGRGRHATVSLLVSRHTSKLRHPTRAHSLRKGKEKGKHTSPTVHPASPAVGSGPAHAPLVLQHITVSSITVHTDDDDGDECDRQLSGAALPKAPTTTNAGSYLLRCTNDGCQAQALYHVSRGRVVWERPLANGRGAMEATQYGVVAACLVDIKGRRMVPLPLCQTRPLPMGSSCADKPSSGGTDMADRAGGSSWMSPLTTPSFLGLPTAWRELKTLAAWKVPAFEETTSDEDAMQETSLPCAFGFDVEPAHPAHFVAVPSSSSSASSSSSLSSPTSSSASSTSSSTESDRVMSSMFNRWQEEARQHLQAGSDDDDDSSEQSKTSDEDSDEAGDGDAIVDADHHVVLPTQRTASSPTSAGELVVVRQRSYCSQPGFAPASHSSTTPPLSPNFATGPSTGAEPTEAAAPPNSFFDDNFDPLLLLGRGATGAALLVRHRVTGVFYAVKVLIARDYESERDILQEVRVHAMLDHKHLVRYYACWSELVTPKRAQQLAFVGLATQRELLLADPYSPARTGSTAALRRQSQRGGSSAAHVPRPMFARSQSAYGSSPSPSPSHVRPGQGLLRVLSTSGWGNLKLDLADQPGTQALLMGEDSMTTVTTATTATTTTGTTSYSSPSRGTANRGSTMSRVQRIRTSSSEDDEDDEDDDDDYRKREDESGSEAAASSADSDCSSEVEGDTVQRRRAHHHHHHGNHPRSSAPSQSIIGSRVVFLQMAFCQMTLGQHLASRAGVDRVENLVIALQLLDGLRYMHKGGVLHRDIKPTNIFLDYRCQLTVDGGANSSDDEDDEEVDEEGRSVSTYSRSGSAAGEGAEKEALMSSRTASDQSGRVSNVGSTGKPDVGDEDEDTCVTADYDAIYSRSCVPSALKTCTALATVPPPGTPGGPTTCRFPSAARGWSQPVCHPTNPPYPGCAGAFHLANGHDTLFPTSSAAPSRTAGLPDYPTPHEDHGPQEQQAAALELCQEQALAMLLQTPHRTSEEMISLRLAALAARAKAKEHRRKAQRQRNLGASSGTAADGGPHAMKQCVACAFPDRNQTAQGIADWLLTHLLQARLGDFGLAKLVGQPCGSPYAEYDRHHHAPSSARQEGCNTAVHPRAQQQRQRPEQQRRNGHDRHDRESTGDAAAGSPQHTVGVGSPLYASPEQFQGGERISVASDGFSLGVVLAEMYIQPTTVSERLHVLQAVRSGHFPTKEDIAQYPELAVVRKLTRAPVSRRMRLDSARGSLRRILVECVQQWIEKDRLQNRQ